MIDKKMKTLIEERKSKNKNDYIGIQDCWNWIIEILSKNEKETINYLYNCSKEELYYISEVFEDISLNLNSLEYIDCLRYLDKKYPDLEMTNDIDIAEEYMSN